MSKVDDAIAEIEKKRAEVESWRQTAEAIEAIVAGFETPALRVSLGYEFGQLHGVLVMTDITDMKEMVPVFRRIRSAGYRVKSHYDYADLNCRTYEMEHIDLISGVVDTGAAPLVVRAFLPWSEDAKAKASCKFVQTGVKEVPVFELKCDATGDEVHAVQTKASHD